MFGGLADQGPRVRGPAEVREQAARGRSPDHAVGPLRPRLRPVARQHVRQAVGRGERRRGQGRPHQQRPAPRTGASEVAAQSGHDLFQFLSPPATYQKQVDPVNDIVQEVRKKVGQMSRSPGRPPTTRGRRSSSASRTTTSPIRQYRQSYLGQAGVSLNTWEDVRKAAPKLKAIGHPVGLGMSNEIDSNMLLMSLLYCYGGFIQNEENRIVIGQGAIERARSRRSRSCATSTRTACRTRSSPGLPPRTTRPFSPAGSRWP